MKALIGTKVGMTQIFDESGNVVRGTVVAAGPCVVTQVKTKTTDGYNAIQLGYGEAKRQTNPLVGHLKKSGANSRVLKEVRLNDVEASEPTAVAETEAIKEALGLEVGTSIDVSVFEAGETIQVTGVSKGKGFAGTIKRHNFSRGPKTHGSHNYRAHGSIGSMFPQHVFKGMKMAGRMGSDQVTVKNLKIVSVDQANNLVVVSGAVPGPKRGTVMIKGL
jgi:large subunit ribosomal protein L3